MSHLVAIVGPTCTGKSRTALKLAQDFNGEIISADSRQVYRHMDIGTAKPNPDELSLVPHHLIDIINPNDDFNLAQYQELAYESIYDVQQHNRLPLLAGGSGLYVWSILEGWEIPQVPPHPEFRHEMEDRVASEGGDELYQQLTNADPVAAQQIDQRNIRRIIRALEVNQHTEIPFSQLRHKKEPPFNKLIIGLTADRIELYRRIDLRVDKMIEGGLIAEVEKLLKMGYNFDLPSMSGIGYKQIGAYLRGEQTLPAAVQQIKFETHRFVRQQYNWFRLKDDRIKWFDIQGNLNHEITTLVAGFLEEAKVNHEVH